MDRGALRRLARGWVPMHPLGCVQPWLTCLPSPGITIGIRIGQDAGCTVSSNRIHRHGGCLRLVPCDTWLVSDAPGALGSAQP